MSNNGQCSPLQYKERLYVLLQNKSLVGKEDVQGMIEEFQGVLCCTQWRVKHEIVADKRLGISLMQVKPNRDRHTATIFIRESLIDTPMATFGPLLLHEVLHLVVDPIAEEHAFQMDYGDETRHKENSLRFLRHLEKVVESIAHSVSEMLGIRDE